MKPANVCTYCRKQWCFCVTAEAGRWVGKYVLRADEARLRAERTREVSGSGGAGPSEE